MNGLSEYLVDSIIKEQTTALFGGGFKPPTKGHLEVVLKGLQQSPEVNKLKILVGKKERDGFTQSQSMKIWNFYNDINLLPVETEVIPVDSPFNYYKKYLREHPDDKVYVFLGSREGNEGDQVDVKQRSKFLEKYSDNVIPLEVSTPGATSGTEARKLFKTDISSLRNFFPENLTDGDFEKILNILGKKELNEIELNEVELRKYVEKAKKGFKKFIEALKQESKETKEAFKLLSQSVKGEKQLSKEEKKEIGNQLKDIFKTIGYVGLFALPGGSIFSILFNLLKLNKYVLPSAFISENLNEGIDKATKIFVMKSPFAPKGQKWDHIGFILKDGRLKDMSGHRYDEKGKKDMPPLTYKYEDIEELFNMPKDKNEAIKKGIYKEKPLPKPIDVPSEIACDISDPNKKAENCGSFVKIVLSNNEIETTKSNWMGDIYDSLKENLNESSEDKILYAFDLDDTLITSKSSVIVTNPEQGTFKLTPAEYALYEPGPNDELDFSEFAHLKNPRVIKDNFELFSQILNKSSQLTGAKTIILTARQPEVATDLEIFLEKNNLPQVTLHAVGSSDPEEKLKVVQDYIDNGFNKIRFYDDSHKNVELIKSLNSPEVDVISKLVKHSPLGEILKEESDPFDLIQLVNEVMEEEEFNYTPYIDSLNDYMIHKGMNVTPLPSLVFIHDDGDNA